MVRFIQAKELRKSFFRRVPITPELEEHEALFFKSKNQGSAGI